MQPLQQSQQPVADLITKFDTMAVQNQPSLLYRVLPSKKTVLKGIDLALMGTLLTSAVIALAGISCPEKEAVRIHYPWCRTPNAALSLGGACVAAALLVVQAVADRL